MTDVGKYFMYRGTVWHEDDWYDFITDLAEDLKVDRNKLMKREREKRLPIEVRDGKVSVIK